jgi:hypothetical protein
MMKKILCLVLLVIAQSQVYAQNGDFTSHGIALKSLSTVAAVATGNFIYGATKSGEYCRVYRYNIALNKVDIVVPIKSAKGAWTIIEDGNYLYIGTYLTASLYRFNKITHVLDKVAAVNGESYIWALTKDTDGSILMTTYPHAKILKYIPASGKLVDLGSFSKSMYVRSVATHGGMIYAGIGANAALIEYSEASHSKKNILPKQYMNDAFIYSINKVGTKLILGLSPSNRVIEFDLNTRIFKQLIADFTVKAIPPKTAKSITHFEGISSHIFEYNPALGTLYNNSPMPLAAGIFKQGILSGITRDVQYMELASDGNIVKQVNLSEHGLEPIKAEPMSITALNGKVYMGERQLRMYDATTRVGYYRYITGEAKAMCIGWNSLFSAQYTGAVLWKWDILHWNNSGNIIWDIGNEQNRPISIKCSSDHVVITTESNYGTYGGAVSIYAKDGTRKIVRNIVPQHSVLDAVLDSRNADILYAGTSVTGGTGTLPIAGNGHIVKYNVANRKILFDIIPKLNNTGVATIEYSDNSIYAAMSDGALYKLDANTGKTKLIHSTAKITKLMLSVTGNLYGISTAGFFSIDKVKLTLTLLKSLPRLTKIVEDKSTHIIYLISGYDLISYQPA